VISGGEVTRSWKQWCVGPTMHVSGGWATPMRAGLTTAAR
jgi:hypothetical protein